MTSQNSTIAILSPPTFNDSLDFVALAVQIAHLVAILILGILTKRGWLKLTTNTISNYLSTLCLLCFVWQLLGIWYFYFSGSQYVNWFYGTLGATLSALTVLGQLEILKALTPISRYFTVKNVTGIQIFFGVLYSLVLIIELARLPSVTGIEPPLVKLAYERGYAGFLIVCILYESFHCVYMAQALYKHAKKQSKLELLDPAAWKIQDDAYKQLIAFVTFIFFFSWLAAILWVMAFNQDTFSNESLISNNLGAFHIFFVVLIFKEIRKINIKKEKSTSGSSQNRSYNVSQL
ncbi:hypothetical protein BC833DRAFT_594610 [Globomyces pollinis-pini]|nr:hypothetical protein BC833DRAFT_594610 [Globomyces pollinis-pini]